VQVTLGIAPYLKGGEHVDEGIVRRIGQLINEPGRIRRLKDELGSKQRREG
jgi:hypothetical protein